MPSPQITPEQFSKLYDYYREHPVEFVREVLGAEPWEMQAQIIDDVFKYSRVAVKTCNSIGKTYIAARIAVAYLMLHKDSIVVTTASTYSQVVNALWREIRVAVEDAEKIKGFQLTDKKVNQVGLDLGKKWYALGRSVSNPDNFMGIHADHLLLIVDEAGAIDNRLYQGFRAITTNIDNKVLLIGNPTTPDGEFQAAFSESSKYIQHTISAFDTPNLVANGIRTTEDLMAVFTPPPGLTNRDRIVWHENKKREMVIPQRGLIHPGDVYEKLIDWGEDSPAWQSLVLGEFPNQAEQALIPANLVTMAMNMYGTDDETGKSYAEISGWNIPDGPPAYGQDMARQGMDLNVCTPRRGGWVDRQIIWNKKGEGKRDLVESAELIINSIIDPLDDNVVFNIDDTGNGGGTTDHMRYLSRQSYEGGNPAHRYRLIPYNMSSKKFMLNKNKYHDITSEIYWNLAEQFKNKAIAMYPDEQLKRELISRRWGITPDGKIKVESKDEYRKRTGGKSPDRSDSLALAFARYRPNVQKPSEPASEPAANTAIAPPRATDPATTIKPTEPVGSGFLQRF